MSSRGWRSAPRDLATGVVASHNSQPPFAVVRSLAVFAARDDGKSARFIDRSPDWQRFVFGSRKTRSGVHSQTQFSSSCAQLVPLAQGKNPSGAGSAERPLSSRGWRSAPRDLATGVVASHNPQPQFAVVRSLAVFAARDDSESARFINRSLYWNRFVFGSRKTRFDNSNQATRCPHCTSELAGSARA